MLPAAPRGFVLMRSPCCSCTRLYAPDESSHLAPGPPRRRIDHEAGVSHHTLGVAIRMTAAHEPGPRRLHPILSSRFPGLRRADVLEHPDGAARPQHAPHFHEALRGIGNAAEDEAAHDR